MKLWTEDDSEVEAKPSGLLKSGTALLEKAPGQNFESVHVDSGAVGI